MRPNAGQVLERCPQCGKPYKAVHEMRRLGMDEAEVEVVCRCSDTADAAYLTASLSRAMVSVPWTATEGLEGVGCRERIPEPHVARSAYVEVEIRLSGTIAEAVYDSIASEPEVRSELGVATSMVVDDMLLSCKLRVRSSEMPTLKAQVSSVDVCPGMSIHESIECVVEDTEVERLMGGRPRGEWYSDAALSKVVRHPDWVLRCDLYRSTGAYSAELEFPTGTRPLPELISAGLEWLHSRFAHAPSLSPYISGSLVAACRTSEIRVLDVLAPPESSLVYKVKADGESAWAVDVGYMWYVCRSHSDLEVTSWIPKLEPSEFAPRSVTVLRVEQLADGSIVYIDTLCDRGVPVAPSRPYVAQSVELSVVPAPVGLIVRREHDHYSSALADKASGGLPSDGIVAIERCSRLTHRMKMPTVDLVVEGGCLRCRDPGPRSPRFAAHARMRQGAVYECRLGTLADGSVAVVSFAPRPDKSRPNRSDVLDDIVRKAQGLSSDAVVLARELTVGSFAVRSYVHSVAVNMRVGGRLIIDVGSGRLQAQSLYAVDSCAYMLCDPALDLRSLPRDVRVVDCTSYDAKSLLAAMRRANHGIIELVVYRRAIEQLLSEPEVVRYIVSARVPMMYMFSLSRVYETFARMSKLGASQVGCGFMYDKADALGFIVNDSGLVMQELPARRGVARVAVPPDAEYEEPALRASWIQGVRGVQPASAVVEQLRLMPPRSRSMFDNLYVVS